MRDMKIKILKLIREYAATNRKIDESFIRRMLDIIVQARKLENYVKVEDTKIVDSGFSIASYKLKLKRIELDLKAHEDTIIDFCSSFCCDSFIKKYCSYIIMCETLAHECSHAEHILDIDSNKLDVRTRILKTSYSLSDDDPLELTEEEISKLNIVERYLYTKRRNEYIERAQTYYIFHDLAPEERMADFFAMRLTSDVLNTLNETENGKLSILDSFYRYTCLDDLLYPYKKASTITDFFKDRFDSPTMRFFDLMELENIDDFIGIEDNLDMRTRFECGLHLYEAERTKLSCLRDNFEKRYSIQKKCK